MLGNVTVFTLINLRVFGRNEPKRYAVTFNEHGIVTDVHVCGYAGNRRAIGSLYVWRRVKSWSRNSMKAADSARGSYRAIAAFFRRYDWCPGMWLQRFEAYVAENAGVVNVPAFQAPERPDTDQEQATMEEPDARLVELVTVHDMNYHDALATVRAELCMSGPSIQALAERHPPEAFRISDTRKGMTYATLDYAQKHFEAGITGRTVMLDGELLEMLADDTHFCWVSWHDVERATTWDRLREDEVRACGLYTPPGYEG